jgi:glycosyltransferase involved in cell wall biosynthesis
LVLSVLLYDHFDDLRSRCGGRGKDPGGLAKPIGIVIPTHNRSAALMECLAHLERQTFNDFEVVVVDDGSSDDTLAQMEAYQIRTPLTMRYLRQENSGPAKARNAAISRTESPICLMLGDDIFASPTLVEQHLHVHQEDPDIRVAALGRTRWSTSGQKVTAFMRWLDEGNVQFSYPLLLAGAKPDWPHFYTSNLSVKTELLRRFAFNEVFPYAAMEDMELAYRVKKSVGLEVKFLADALADHLHPTTFRGACARMIRAGYSMGLFYDLWPEQRPPQWRGRRQAILEALARHPRLLKLLTAALDPIADELCPQPFVLYLLFSHFEVGLLNQLNSKQRLAPASA